MNSNSQTVSEPARLRQISEFGLAFVLFLAALVMLQYLWNCDDAFISYRFARNFADGFGLRFNIANEQPVEGYTNLLWVLIAAVFEFLQIASYKIMPLISIFCALYLVIRVYRASQNYFNHSKTISLSAAALVAFFPPFAVWASGGLETMPFALLLFMVFEELLYKERVNFKLLCLCGLGLALIRAEGALWAFTFIALAVLFKPAARGVALRFAAWIVLIVVVHTALRYSYYGEFFPNTAAAKMGFAAERLQRGSFYILVFSLTFILPFFAPLALCLERNRITFLTTLGFVGFYAYSVVSGGDYMSMGRFLVPAIPFQALLYAVILNHLAFKSACTAVLLFAAGMLLAWLPMVDYYIVPHAVRAALHFRLNSNNFLDERDHLRFMVENSRRWRATGEMLAQIAQPGDSMVEGTIGNIGYFSRLYIYDRLGLVTKLPKEFKRSKMSSPGHDMRAPLDYFLQYEPTFLYANLERLRKFGRLKELEGLYPYAPVIAPAEYGHKEPYVFVSFTRAASNEEYVRRWEELRQELQAARQ